MNHQSFQPMQRHAEADSLHQETSGTRDRDRIRRYVGSGREQRQPLHFMLSSGRHEVVSARARRPVAFQELSSASMMRPGRNNMSMDDRACTHVLTAKVSPAGRRVMEDMRILRQSPLCLCDHACTGGNLSQVKGDCTMHPSIYIHVQSSQPRYNQDKHRTIIRR